jgi:fatty-acyl-CoA synthase
VIQADLLGERARLTPDVPALVDVHTGSRYSYRELDARAVACARVWRERLGLGHGDRVGLLSHNRVEMLDAFFAAGKSGVVLVPMGTRLTAAELAHLVADSGMRALLYDGELAATVEKLAARPELADAALDTFVALDAPAAPDHLAYRDLAAALPPSEWRRERCDPEDLYCLLYTSGTTGKPKGVMTPHRMIAWNGYNTVVSWSLTADDVSPIFTPLYHSGGLGAFLVPLVVAGGTVVLHRGFDPAEIWRTVEAEGCTVVLGVPTIWKLLLEAPELAATDLSSVRWLISGGAPLPLWIIEAYQRRGVVFKQGYGLTEVGVNCFAMTVEDSVAKRGSIGTPMMGTEAKLVDAEGAEVGDDVVGELCLRGPHVCQGYWHAPEATAAALDAGGWFHTGDMARRDADGFYTIAGRAKDMFISGGVNVYPAEIEAALLLHPGVEDAAVTGVPHEQWGEQGVAWIVPRSDPPPSPDELAAHLEERIARFKVPRAWRYLDALPRTAYGKVVKGELAARWGAEQQDEEVP